jgi:predicted glutamine amidotransferase
MCELLGQSSDHAMPIADAFGPFIGRGAENPDGWGVGRYEGGEARVLKEPVPIGGSPEAARIASGERDILSRLFVCHVRKASMGAGHRRLPENTHPFQGELWGEDWLFAHNGTFHKRFPSTLGTGRRPRGGMDSEMAFCWVLDRLSRGGPPKDRRERCERVDRAVHRLAEAGGGRCRFNLLMSDPTTLYAFGWGDKHLQCLLPTGGGQAPTGPARRAEGGGRVLVASRAPRPLVAGEWLPLPDGVLLVATGSHYGFFVGKEWRPRLSHPGHTYAVGRAPEGVPRRGVVAPGDALWGSGRVLLQRLHKERGPDQALIGPDDIRRIGPEEGTSAKGGDGGGPSGPRAGDGTVLMGKWMRDRLDVMVGADLEAWGIDGPRLVGGDDLDG